MAGYYPVVAVTGPRQSGKTTLCRMVFPDKPCVLLAALDMRELARTDPRGFLPDHGSGAILDEIQQAPELLSYLQGEVDFSERLGEAHATRIGERYLVCGGGASQKRSQAQVLSWRHVQRIPTNSS